MEKSKNCSICGELKTLDNFHKNHTRKDGHSNECKICRRKSRIKIKIKELLPEGYKRCNYCKELKELNKFGKNKSLKDGYKNQCKECRNIKYIRKIKIKEPLSSESKKCSICDIVKPLNEFGKNITMKDGHRYECYECRRNKVVKIKEKLPDGYKKCGHCKEIKELLEFNNDVSTKTGFSSICKKCANKNKKEKYRKTHILKVKEILPDGYKRCSKCKIIKLKIEFGTCSKNIDKLKYSCKECRKNTCNNEKRKLYINNWTNEYNRKNPHLMAWRNLLKHSLERLGKPKEDLTINLLKYSAVDLKNYISEKFTEGMSWENYGEWHIDHIIPVSKFDKNTPPSIVNALINLQPLWATSRWINDNFYLGNLNKSNKIYEKNSNSN